MTDYLNPHRIYPDDISRRIDIPPGFDSVRPAVKESLTTGCEYCNDTNEQKPLYYANNYEPYEGMVSVIEISGAWNGIKPMIEVDLWDGANVSAVFEINYCPMCGRKLEESK